MCEGLRKIRITRRQCEGDQELLAVSSLGAYSWPHPAQSHGARNRCNSPWQQGLHCPNICQEIGMEGWLGLVVPSISQKLLPESSTWKCTTFLGFPKQGQLTEHEEQVMLVGKMGCT